MFLRIRECARVANCWSKRLENAAQTAAARHNTLSVRSTVPQFHCPVQFAVPPGPRPRVEGRAVERRRRGAASACGPGRDPLRVRGGPRRSRLRPPGRTRTAGGRASAARPASVAGPADGSTPRIASRARRLYRDGAIVIVLALATAVAGWSVVAWYAALAGLWLILRATRRDDAGPVARDVGLLVALVWSFAALVLITLIATTADPFGLREAWHVSRPTAPIGRTYRSTARRRLLLLARRARRRDRRLRDGRRALRRDRFTRAAGCPPSPHGPSTPSPSLASGWPTAALSTTRSPTRRTPSSAPVPKCCAAAG